MAPMSPSEALVARELFGGALFMGIPKRFVDVSDFRPVPDHQEVWADGGTDQSVVVEIVERAASSDTECGRFFFEDMSRVNDSAGASISDVHKLDTHALPALATAGGQPFACLVTGSQHVSKERQDRSAVNQVLVLLVVLRLPQVHSDLLITMNTPTFISESSSSAAHVAPGMQPSADAARPLLLDMLQSLQIRDWGLFGEG